MFRSSMPGNHANLQSTAIMVTAREAQLESEEGSLELKQMRGTQRDMTRRQRSTSHCHLTVPKHSTKTPVRKGKAAIVFWRWINNKIKWWQHSNYTQQTLGDMIYPSYQFLGSHSCSLISSWFSFLFALSLTIFSVCVHMCTCVYYRGMYVCMHLYVCVYAYVCACVYVCIFCIYVYVCICVYIKMYVFICMFICMCVYVLRAWEYIYVSMCIYVCACFLHAITYMQR